MAFNTCHFYPFSFEEEVVFMPAISNLHVCFFMLLQLQDYTKTPAGESEVKFTLSRVTLEPTLRSMAYISEQLSTANKVAVINLKVCGTQFWY